MLRTRRRHSATFVTRAPRNRSCSGSASPQQRHNTALVRCACRHADIACDDLAVRVGKHNGKAWAYPVEHLRFVGEVILIAPVC
jgi:hypothetical protein